MSLPEQPRRPKIGPVRIALVAFLILLAAGSASTGIRDALHRSQDFQWSGAHLLDQRIDPWAVYLRGDPEHQLVATQIPNYLPVLYVLMSPLGLLKMGTANLVWALCNLAFALLSGYLAARFYGLRGRSIVALICLFLIATPTRTSIGNGQQSLFVLFIWCATLLVSRASSGQAALAGLSYAKFSFAPPMFLYLLFRSGVRKALLSLLPIAAGTALVWLWLTGGHSLNALGEIAREPFLVARTGFRLTPDDQNLMNIVQSILPASSQAARTAAGLGLALVVCAVISWLACKAHQGSTAQWQITLMATMSFALFNHHSYDGVVLLLPLCYALRHWQNIGARVTVGLLAYLFYLQRVLEALHLHPSWAKYMEFGMLMSILVLTYRMRETESLTEVIPEEQPYLVADEVAIAS